MKINFKKKLGGPIKLGFIVILLLVLFIIVSYIDFMLEQPKPTQQTIETNEEAEEEQEEEFTKVNMPPWGEVEVIKYPNGEVWYKECEKYFEKPIDIIWDGGIFFYMMSGQAFGIRRIPENKDYPNFFACCIEGENEKGEWILTEDKIPRGKVRVKGKWTGATCVYTNAAFGGNLVPNVEIEKIEEIQQYTPVTYLNDLKWWTAKITENNKYAYIDIEYPQFIGGDEVRGLNEYIKETVLNVLNTDRNEVKEWIADKREPCEGTELYKGRLWSCSVQLVSEYEVISVINDIVSLELVITDYTGGGNGNHSTAYVVSWDLKNNRLLNKKDIFCSKEYPAELADLVYENISNQFKNEFSWDESILNMLKKDINEELQSSDVLLGYRGLSIVFQPYAVLSGAFGIVRAPIPYSDLKNKVCL